MRLPPGSVDCHAHVFEHLERYPLARPRSFTPCPCPLDEYLALLASIGATRCVLVTASCHGFDNRPAADAMARLGERALGVAVVPPDVGADELALLDAAGFRAARLTSQRVGGAGTDAFEAVAARVAPLGWHVEINVARSDEWIELAPRLAESPVPVVLEHLARVRGDEGPDSRGLGAALALCRGRRDFFVKLASWYRLSAAGPPEYADMAPVLDAWLDALPDRVVWGSNWPHPGWDGAMPHDADLLEWAQARVPSALQAAVFRDNALRLYGFPAESGSKAHPVRFNPPGTSP
ncbi:MAG TPA: amidohydrolase family protein [Pelomicrobium sp.]|nr:amidohydrolase family protein [Pelomicrobium sp.]